MHRRVRALAKEAGRDIGTLVDLPGPKIRAASFGRDGVDLPDGHRIRLVPGDTKSTAEVIEVGYESLLGGIEVGDRISFGDGAIDIEVVDTTGDHLEAVVSHGGRLSGRPGVHIPSERLRVSTPTPEDLRILDAFVEAGVDMVAVSFVRSAHDIRRLGTEPHPRGPLVVAKIETRSAVDNLAGILEAAGAIMIARGDLGIECSIEDLPHLQKHIIRECIAHGRPAITATQMLESMAHAADADPRRGLRRRERGLRRFLGGDALGRDRRRGPIRSTSSRPWRACAPGPTPTSTRTPGRGWSRACASTTRTTPRAATGASPTR